MVSFASDNARALAEAAGTAATPVDETLATAPQHG